METQFLQHHLVKRLSFPTEWSWSPRQRTNWPYIPGFIFNPVLYSMPGSLFYSTGLFIFLPVPHCFGYSSFEVSFGIRKYEASNFVSFFFKIVLTFQGPLKFCVNVSMDFSNSENKKVIRIFTRIALNLYVSLGSMSILTISSSGSWTQDIFPFLHIFFSLFRSLICFRNVLQFIMWKTFTSLVKFTPKYFILFDAFVNETVSIISVSDCCCVCRKTADFLHVELVSCNCVEFGH